MRKSLSVVLLLIVVMFMTGCLGTGTTDKETKLSVSWRSKERISALSVLSTEEEPEEHDGIVLDVSNLSYTDSPLEGGWLIAEASVQGAGRSASEFEFQVLSDNEYEIDGNRITIDRIQAETGKIFVKYGDLEVVSPFRIYQAIALGSQYTPIRQIYTHYNFETGVSNKSGDIYMEPETPMIWAPYGYATMPKGSTYDLFWGDFPTDIDFEALDYTVGSFVPDYETLYCVKTANGYAKLIFTSYQMVGRLEAHNFIYDYFPN